jgi:hypothetical protein
MSNRQIERPAGLTTSGPFFLVSDVSINKGGKLNKLLLWIAEKLVQSEAFMTSIPLSWASRLDEYVYGEWEPAGFDCY